MKCKDNCLSCNKEECFQCKEGLFMKEDKCVIDCGKGSYSDKKSLTCEACEDGCLDCDAQLCYECAPAYTKNYLL